MKALTLFILLIVSFSSVNGQGMDGLLNKVSQALEEGKNEQAAGYFRQAIYADIDKAEAYYHTTLFSSIDQCPQIAVELATFYKKGRNFERVVPFAADLVKAFPDHVEYLDLLAEAEAHTGEKMYALKLYERLLELEPDHLAGNIYMGNYYFFIAEKKKRAIDSEYRRKGSVSRRNESEYADGLFTIYIEDYRRAKNFLENVMRIFPSTEANKSLLKISHIEEELNRIKGQISLL